MSLCVIIFFSFLPQISKQSQEKKEEKKNKKLFTLFSALGHQRLYAFVQTVKPRLFTGAAEEQFDNGDPCVYTVY